MPGYRGAASSCAAVDRRAKSKPGSFGSDVERRELDVAFQGVELAPIPRAASAVDQVEHGETGEDDAALRTNLFLILAPSVGGEAFSIVCNSLQAVVGQSGDTLADTIKTRVVTKHLQDGSASFGTTCPRTLMRRCHKRHAPRHWQGCNGVDQQPRFQERHPKYKCLVQVLSSAMDRGRQDVASRTTARTAERTGRARAAAGRGRRHSATSAA